MMIKRYYFYSANLHSNENDPSEITGYVSGIVWFKTLLALNPIQIKQMAEDFVISDMPTTKVKSIQFLTLERFKS